MEQPVRAVPQNLYKRESVCEFAEKQPHACDISIHLVFVISLVLCVAVLSGIWPNYAGLSKSFEQNKSGVKPHTHRKWARVGVRSNSGYLCMTPVYFTVSTNKNMLTF